MKGISSGFGYAAGYILGGTIVIPLAYYLISIIFYAPRKTTEAMINQYTTDTITMRDNIGKLPPLDDDKLGLQIKSYELYLDRRNTGSQQYFGYVFYSYKYHKYIQLISIVEGVGVVRALYDVDFIMTVNKEDYNNPVYGTIDNPVPVFKFVGAGESIRDNNKDFDTAYMDTVFHNNVKIYLQYIMPKKEFKTRYGK